MKRLILAILLLSSVQVHAQKTLDDGLTELATQISARVADHEKRRIAVLPFHELDGQPTVMGTFLAEELVTRLFQLGNFKIVERQLLDKVMGELRIERTGAIDPATAKEIGRIAGVDAIVTGSITELERYVALNCRLIDTSTGEVFGAAQTKLSKDEDVAKIMNSAITSGGSTDSQANYQAMRPIASKDLSMLRVTLKSVTYLASTNSVRWTFAFENREARRPIVVALNAEGQDIESAAGVKFGSGSASTQLRTSAVDDHGGLWNLTSNGIGGIGFVRVGVHGHDGREVYNPMEIARLLRLRDELGRESDDPSDGVMAQATSMGAGGQNITFNSGRNTSPMQFFPYRGNRFVSGTTTSIEPGQRMTVTMNFIRKPAGPLPSSESIAFQFSGEIVVGIGDAKSPRRYTLHTLSFDRVNLPTK